MLIYLHLVNAMPAILYSLHPANSIFLAHQTSSHQPANSNFLSQQINTRHPPRHSEQNIEQHTWVIIIKAFHVLKGIGVQRKTCIMMHGQSKKLGARASTRKSSSSVGF